MFGQLDLYLYFGYGERVHIIAGKHMIGYLFHYLLEGSLRSFGVVSPLKNFDVLMGPSKAIVESL